MDLGERIYRLRTERNMSQGDLAEALDVSRQSISKWENNSAVPELDKLVKLSALFGVTLDELVKGEKPAEEPKAEPAPQVVTVIQRGSLPPRKIAGIVLFCMAFVVLLVCMVLGGFLEGLIFSIPFLMCGAVCFLVSRYPGLYCAWTICFLTLAFLSYATSINWRLIFLTLQFEESWNYTRLIAAWVVFLLMLLLILWTVMAYRKDPVELSRKNCLLFIGGLIAYLVLKLPISLGINWYWLMVPLDMVRMILFTALLSVVVRWIGQKKVKNS